MILERRFSVMIVEVFGDDQTITDTRQSDSEGVEKIVRRENIRRCSIGNHPTSEEHDPVA